MLIGTTPMDHDLLVMLIDECDYLWAQFPEYTVRDLRPGNAKLAEGDSSAISFLKRLRVEIDPVLKLWEMTLLQNKMLID
jgi:hypothetical protein